MQKYYIKCIYKKEVYVEKYKCFHLKKCFFIIMT